MYIILSFFYFLHYYKRLHAIKIIIIWEWNVGSDQLLTAREINWRQWGFEKFATFLFYFGQFLCNSVDVNILPRLSWQIFLWNGFKQRQLLRPKVSLVLHSYIYPIDFLKKLSTFQYFFTVWCSYNLQVMHLNAQKEKKKVQQARVFNFILFFAPQ